MVGENVENKSVTCAWDLSLDYSQLQNDERATLKCFVRVQVSVQQSILDRTTVDWN